MSKTERDLPSPQTEEQTWAPPTPSPDALRKHFDRPSVTPPEGERDSEHLTRALEGRIAAPVLPPVEHRDTKLKPPERKRSKRPWAIAAGALAALTAGTGAFVASQGSPDESAPVPTMAAPPNTAPTPTAAPAEVITAPVLRTPEVPNSDDPQVLMNSLFQNYDNAFNYALEDPEFSQDSLNLYFPEDMVSSGGTYFEDLEAAVAEMPAWLQSNPDYRQTTSVVVREADFSNSGVRYVLADVTIQFGDFNTEHSTNRYTLEPIQVSVDTGDLQQEEAVAWLIVSKDIVEPGEVGER